MGKLLREFYNLQYDKNVIAESINNNKPVSLKALLQRADAVNQNGRLYPKKILEREIENYKKVVAEGRAIGECVPEGVEIFTKDKGWIDIKDVKFGDNIYTLNVETNEIQIQPVLERVYKKYTDQLVRIKNNRSLDMIMTKGHRVLMWDRSHKPYSMTAIELYDALKNNNSKVSHSYLRRSGDWKGSEAEYFELPESELKIKIEDWAAFLGIYLAEGHSAGTKGGNTASNVVCISKNPGERQSKIKELLDRLPFNYKLFSDRQFIINNKYLHSYLFQLGNSHSKYIPEDAKSWSPRLLDILLNWMLMGDGKNRKNENGELIKEYSTVSSRLALDVQEVMFKLGTGGSISTRIPIDREIEGRQILAENSALLNVVHQHEAKGIHLKTSHISTELVDYDGYVYCVRVPNETWLMKYNNKIMWTHNCDHPESSVVNLKNASHIIREIWWDDDEVYGNVEILNTPSGKIVESLLSSGVRVGISSRGVGETIKNESGHDIVDENFILVCWDLVGEPSTHEAFLMREGKEISLSELRNSISKIDRINRVINDILKQ